jgi:hypothetical protein
VTAEFDPDKGLLYRMRVTDDGRVIEYIRPGAPPMRWSSPLPQVVDPNDEKPRRR